MTDEYFDNLSSIAKQTRVHLDLWYNSLWQNNEFRFFNIYGIPKKFIKYKFGNKLMK